MAQKAQSRPVNRIDYIEFPVRDLAQAKAFYGAAFGWTFQDYGPSYVGIQGTDGEMGGFALAEEIKVGGPLVILYASDLEASAHAVEQAGGRITRPIFSFPGGRRFHFQDPSGYELAVWSQEGEH
jgi:predicted enzyme related to lactoylglutathione lyase